MAEPAAPNASFRAALERVIDGERVVLATALARIRVGLSAGVIVFAAVPLLFANWRPYLISLVVAGVYLVASIVIWRLLRAGLPWQSVHDGEAYAHEPLRLSVCIEAPRQAISDVMSRHDNVRALFDNGWLHLFALDEEGRMAWRYAGDLQWTAMNDIDAAERPSRFKVAV